MSLKDRKPSVDLYNLLGNETVAEVVRWSVRVEIIWWWQG